MSTPTYAHGRYSGDGSHLFWLAFRTGLLTILTLGIYRFWAKTRVRRYIWSSVLLDDSRFEYTGTGLEKFLGFLMAVVFLAIYLGVVQIVLFYFGLTLFREPDSPEDIVAQVVAGYVTVLSVVPFLFFAIYRARRYRMARTRWRGIRFGMDKAAGGYALRAMGYWLLTILSLGLLLPLQTFRLEKYMVDRTWFGDARFHQGGRWTALYRRMLHIFIGLAILLAAVIGAALSADNTAFLVLPFVATPVGLVWLAVGFISFRVQSFAYLAQNTTLGGAVAFDARPSTPKVILTWILGSLLVGLVISIIVAILGGAGAIVFGGVLSMADGDPGGGTIAATVVLAVMGYVLVLVGGDAGALVAITQPILRHYVETTTLINLPALADIQQRAADPGADAEGFADALDVGGAF